MRKAKRESWMRANMKEREGERKRDKEGERGKEREGWKDADREWRGRVGSIWREQASEKEQVKEGAAINTMTHSIYAGCFLTAFIKSKPNHFGLIIRSMGAPSSLSPTHTHANHME